MPGHPEHAETRLRRTLRAAGLALATALVLVMTLAAEPFEPDAYGPGQDSRAYWAAAIDAPYAEPVGQQSAYLYSPAFLQVLLPLQALPWPAFVALWTGLLLAVLYRLGGPLLFGPLIVLTFPELWGGNITLLLAAAVVVGSRWPGTWALVLLTKVTPGIGLLWFLVRREWRALAWALATTAAVVGVSAAFAPALWSEWAGLLAGSTDASAVPGSLPVPLLVRLPLAGVVVVFAALTDRRWLLPLGAMLALPVLWWGGFAMLVGCLALRRDEAEDWLVGRVRPAVGRLAAQTG